MTDRTGDRKGRPYRCVPRMSDVTETQTPLLSPLQVRAQDETMTDRTGDHKGDPVGAPLAGAPNDTAGMGL